MLRKVSFGSSEGHSTDWASRQNCHGMSIKPAGCGWVRLVRSATLKDIIFIYFISSFSFLKLDGNLKDQLSKSHLLFQGGLSMMGHRLGLLLSQPSLDSFQN